MSLLARYAETGPSPYTDRPDPRLVRAAVLGGASFGALYLAVAWPALTGGSWNDAGHWMLIAKVLVEVAFAFPAATMILLALAYLSRLRHPAVPAPAPAATGAPPPVAILYLCCGDVDRDALRSLLALRYDGELELIVHDDLPGGDPAVDRFAGAERDADAPAVSVLRRPYKGGGKPGAINWVLGEIGDRFDHVLLCDNDSVAVDPDVVPKLVARMRDPRVAVAQCRNVAAPDPHYCRVNRVMSHAIDVFDLFMSTGKRFAWCPFVGHNALLRVAALREVGALTPGCFADDIDLTVRLNLAGHRVEYAADVAFGEKHPPSYAAFRARAYKWAYGSVQVLRRHSRAVLASPRLSFAEKWGFFHFIGFFTLQAVLLAYVAVLLLVAPFLWHGRYFDTTSSVVAGSIIPILIFLPVLVHALVHRRVRDLPAFLATCWLGYGAADVPTARGVLDALRRRPRSWVPTNSLRAGGIDRGQLCESAFGLALLLVPLTTMPALVYSPLTILVATKFLFIPTMSLLYRDGEKVRIAPSKRSLAAAVGVLLLLAGAGAANAQQRAAATSPTIRIAGNRLLVDDRDYVVRGIHYGPWRAGTGPGRNDYPADAAIEEDLALVERLHANTILVFDPPRRVLDAAKRHGVLVLAAAWIEWTDLGTERAAALEERVTAAVETLRDHPALLGWLLGNEVPSWIVEQRGAATVAADIRRLYELVKARDPAHPVTHANWPNTRTLDLSFLDIAAFNLYALWPPEVVAQGYGSFIEHVLRPLAAGKPLLISEYGADSLQAGLDGQARLTAACWRELRAAGCIGGFAFELADEWWKNYSNPKIDGAWWDRETDLDDHLAHDRDPEEHYGLVTAEREPKPAFAAIADAYHNDREPARDAPLKLVAGLIGVAVVSFGWASWYRRRHRRIPPTEDDRP